MVIDPEYVLAGLRQRGWCSLRDPTDQGPWIPSDLLPSGDGVVIASGGSSNGPHCCLQPWHHLDQSAAATATWLKSIGIDPSAAVVLNPLPMHHMSGLMPWWRSRCWRAMHIPIPKRLLKDPAALLSVSRTWSNWGQRPHLVSLVPTQLARLLRHPMGVRWLQALEVIWVGGAALSEQLADQSRTAGLRLAPCFGATETAAMISALPPEDFLAGTKGCGSPLRDVLLRLGADGALWVKSSRLALARWSFQSPMALESLADPQGWWRSGDAADLYSGVTILGRLDGAIHSGGETVFPEQLEIRLLQQIQEGPGLIAPEVLFLSRDDQEWGEIVVALVGSSDQKLVSALSQLTAQWKPAEQPKDWICCPQLKRSPIGKWERARWSEWLRQELERRSRP